MKHLRTPGAAALLALVLMGCDGNKAPVAPAIRADFAFKPWDGVLPAPGNGVTSNEKVEVCKYGSSGSFAYTATDLATNVTNSSTITINDGDCWVLAVFTVPGVDFTVTETSSQAGYQLDHVDLENRSGLVNQPIVTTTGPTVHVITGSHIITGTTIKYYNVATPATGSIGDFVWNDLNGNGVQDSGEPGLGGIVVTLSGPVSGTTTTDGSGAYLFSGLPAGGYTVSVGTPSGFSPSPTGAGTTATDNNGSPALVTLPTGSSTDLTVDFGFVPNPPPPPPPPVCTPASNQSNFNGTAIAPGNTIWFNTIFKPKGVPAGGGTVYFTASSIAITSGANHYTVSVPNAQITFSPSATSASTTYDNGTNTWLTVVPVGYTGNIFLSGVGYVPPGGLPGGANPVTWTGQVTTTMSGFSMQWQWAAAVYTSFGPLGTINVKPIDGSANNPYPNSDHAGVPEAFKGFVRGGARGGGGSNWTGSYSGTVSPPVCVNNPQQPI